MRDAAHRMSAIALRESSFSIPLLNKMATLKVFKHDNNFAVREDGSVIQTLTDTQLRYLKTHLGNVKIEGWSFFPSRVKKALLIEELIRTWLWEINHNEAQNAVDYRRIIEWTSKCVEDISPFRDTDV